MDNGNLNSHIFRHNLFRVHHTDLFLCRNNVLSQSQRPIVYRRKFQFFQTLYHKHRTAQVSERNLSVLKMLCNKIFSLLYKRKGTNFILSGGGKITHSTFCFFSVFVNRFAYFKLFWFFVWDLRVGKNRMCCLCGRLFTMRHNGLQLPEGRDFYH